MKTKLVEIKARYEVAQFAVSTGPVEYTIIESLADIPYLLGELKRVWREVDTGLHLSRYSDANAETSDDMKAVRARYEAAVGCKNSDNLTETGKKIFAALADIPRLLNRLIEQESALTKYKRVWKEALAALPEPKESDGFYSGNFVVQMIMTLRTENKRLRAALRPFAEAAIKAEESYEQPIATCEIDPEDIDLGFGIGLMHLRAARAAMEEYRRKQTQSDFHGQVLKTEAKEG